MFIDGNINLVKKGEEKAFDVFWLFTLFQTLLCIFSSPLVSLTYHSSSARQGLFISILQMGKLEHRKDREPPQALQPVNSRANTELRSVQLQSPGSLDYLLSCSSAVRDRELPSILISCVAWTSPFLTWVLGFSSNLRHVNLILATQGVAHIPAAGAC